MLTRCFCCGPCSVIADTLASNNLGLYTQVAGTWSHSSGYYGTTSANAILIHTVEPAPETKKLRVTAQVRPAALGDEVHVYFGWLDANNHLVGRLTLEEDCRLFEVFELAGGVETKIGDVDCAGLKLPTGTQYLQIRIDWDGDVLGVTVEFVDFTFDPEPFGSHGLLPYTTEPPGTRCGVGTGVNTGTFKLLALDVTRFRSDCLTVTRATCLVTRDGFTRANAADPGCRWEVRAGGFSIDAKKIVPTGAGSVIHKREFPVGSHKNVAVLNPGAAGGVLRSIVAWSDDDNYLFARYEVGGEVRLWRRLAGVETQISPARVETFTAGGTAAVSYDGTRISAGGGGGGRLTGYAPGFTGRRIGFASENVTAGQTIDTLAVFSPLVYAATETNDNCNIKAYAECATANCNTFAPGRLTASLPGLLNGTCGNCGDLAQALLLTGGIHPIQGFGVNYGFSTFDCIWGYRGGFVFCSYDTLEAYVGFATWSGVSYLTGFIGVSDSLGAAKINRYFRAANPAPYDCLSWNGLQLAEINGQPTSASGIGHSAPYNCAGPGFPGAAGPMEIWAEL